MSKIISGSFVLSAVVDGEDAIIYEIVPTNAYCIHNPNETEHNVKGLIEGYLYKIVGTERTPVVHTDMEVGYNVPMSKGDTNGIFDVRTDGNGFFTSGRESQALFNDTYGDDVMGESTAIVARYKVGNEVLAQINVGISQYGMKGERGAPLRISYWEAGWTYYTGKNANDPYTDVVIVGDNYYLCMSNHTAKNSNKPVDGSTDKTYWQKSSKIDMVATEVLLADNAHINLLSSNGINVKDSSGNTTAGMSGGDGVQLWAGGGRDTAKFRVKEDGDVYVEGTVNAKNLFRSICIVFAKGTYLNLDNSGNYKEYAYILHTDAIYDYIDNSVGDLTDEQKEEWKSYYIAGTYVSWKDAPLYTQIGYDMNQMDGVLKCTYNADCIQLVDESTKEFPDEAIINLPNPKDFAGKFVTVDHSSTEGKTTTGGHPKVAFVQCVGEYKWAENVKQFVRDAYKFLIGLENNGGELTGQPYNSITINAGEVRRFYSTGVYWLPL